MPSPTPGRTTLYGKQGVPVMTSGGLSLGAHQSLFEVGAAYYNRWRRHPNGLVVIRSDEAAVRQLCLESKRLAPYRRNLIVREDPAVLPGPLTRWALFHLDDCVIVLTQKESDTLWATGDLVTEEGESIWPTARK